MGKRGFTQGGKILCRKWYEWLEEMKRDETEKMEEMHQQKVAPMMKSADGSADSCIRSLSHQHGEEEYRS